MFVVVFLWAGDLLEIFVDFVGKYGMSISVKDVGHNDNCKNEGMKYMY